MSVTSLQIQDLFNLISTHFVDNFNRFSTSTVSNWKHIDTSIYISFNDDKAFTYNNLSALIEKIFVSNDLSKCGENAVRFVQFVKNNLTDDKLSWASITLKEFCTSANTNFVSSPLINNNNESTVSSGPSQPLSSDQINNASNNPESSNNNTALLESMKNIIKSSVESQIKFFMVNSMSKSVKDEHYQELEAIMTRKVILDNSLTINKQYNTNKVFQKSINSSNFPKPWITDDPIFVDKFNKLIIQFQTQIQDMNILHIQTKLEVVQKGLDTKLELINNFDPSATEKSGILENQAIQRQLNSLTKSTEKVNRLISLNNPVSNSKQTTQVTSTSNNSVEIIESPQINNQVPSNNIHVPSNNIQLPSNNNQLPNNNNQNRSNNKNTRTSYRKTSNQYSSTAMSQQSSQSQSYYAPNQNNQNNNNRSYQPNNHSFSSYKPQSSAYNYSNIMDIPGNHVQSN